MKYPRNLTGEKFGRLRVLRLYDKKHGMTRWLCECECGKEKIIYRCNLTNGDSKSCGCLHREIASTHGLSKHPLYEVWISMRKRCENKNHMSYANYGARGIKVCEEWSEDFQKFYDWAYINGYKKGLTLDRKDNDGNYEPSNCRWVSRLVQNNNTRKNVFIEIEGEKKTIAEWARIAGVYPKTIQYRLQHGYTERELISKPNTVKQKRRCSR